MKADDGKKAIEGSNSCRNIDIYIIYRFLNDAREKQTVQIVTLYTNNSTQYY